MSYIDYSKILHKYSIGKLKKINQNNVKFPFNTLLNFMQVTNYQEFSKTYFSNNILMYKTAAVGY